MNHLSDEAVTKHHYGCNWHGSILLNFVCDGDAAVAVIVICEGVMSLEGVTSYMVNTL